MSPSLALSIDTILHDECPLDILNPELMGSVESDPISHPDPDTDLPNAIDEPTEPRTISGPILELLRDPNNPVPPTHVPPDADDIQNLSLPYGERVQVNELTWTCVKEVHTSQTPCSTAESSDEEDSPLDIDEVRFGIQLLEDDGIRQALIVLWGGYDKIKEQVSKLNCEAASARVKIHDLNSRVDNRRWRQLTMLEFSGGLDCSWGQLLCPNLLVGGACVELNAPTIYSLNHPITEDSWAEGGSRRSRVS